MSCKGGTKFRYIIHGVPKNKKYTVEEAQWCDVRQQFIYEQIHTVTPQTVKQWIGYIPSSIGDLQTTMWMVFPLNVFDPSKSSSSSPTQPLTSPLKAWEDNHSAYVPNNLERFRFFPQGTCQEQASQIGT